MAINLRKPQEIERLRDSNVIVAKALKHAEALARPGVSLLEMANSTESYIKSLGGRPSFKGLYGFPGAICISVNEVIIHGIPTEYKLQEGDIVGIDIGVEYKGWFGDAAITVPVGKVKAEDTRLMDCSRMTLEESIAEIREGMRFKELSALLQELIIKKGFVPLRNFCGHGIGKRPHEEPEIPNYLDNDGAKQGPKIKNGMVFCIEPMVCVENGESKILEDKWSVVSTDNKRGSHHEHTVAIIDKKAVILSKE